MKVTITVGPNHEQAKEEAYKIFADIIRREQNDKQAS